MWAGASKAYELALETISAGRETLRQPAATVALVQQPVLQEQTRFPRFNPFLATPTVLVTCFRAVGAKDDDVSIGK